MWQSTDLESYFDPTSGTGLGGKNFSWTAARSNRHDNDERKSIRSILEAIAVYSTEGETEESWIYSFWCINRWTEYFQKRTISLKLPSTVVIERLGLGEYFRPNFSSGEITEFLSSLSLANNYYCNGSNIFNSVLTLIS